MERKETVARVPVAVPSPVVLCIVLAIAGCGSGNESSASSDAKATTTGSASTGRTIAGKTRPDVEVPDIPLPTKLIAKDLEMGQGAKARFGDRVKLEYVGISWAGGSFTDSWSYPTPPVFELGGREGQRLEYGLDLGVRGMKPGGRREVIVPAELLYWPDQQHESLGSSNTVVFVVDLLGIE